MSDNIIDFNKRKRERVEAQPLEEVSMEALLAGLASAPQNGLMASVAQCVQEKLTRLLILADIASKASETLASYGFDPNNFYLEDESLERYLAAKMDDGENALWNGPFFDWDADDEYDTTVRLVTTVRFLEEDGEDVSLQLAMDLFKLGADDENWSHFNDGEWVQDGPPADLFDALEYLDSYDDDWDDDDDDDEDWDDDDDDDDDDERSIYMFNFSSAAMKALTLAGIETVDQLKAMTDKQRAAIPGLSGKDLARINRVLAFDDDDMHF